MKYAVTITTNNKRISGDKQLFINDVLRYILTELHYDVQHFEYVIEHAPTMGYHLHGIFDSQNSLLDNKMIIHRNLSRCLFYFYQKELKDNDITNWRLYMHKDVYVPAILLDE